MKIIKCKNKFEKNTLKCIFHITCMLFVYWNIMKIIKCKKNTWNRIFHIYWILLFVSWSFYIKSHHNHFSQRNYFPLSYVQCQNTIRPPSSYHGFITHTHPYQHPPTFVARVTYITTIYRRGLVVEALMLQ